MKTLSDEELDRLGRIKQTYERGDYIITDDINFFLEVTHEFDRVLKSLAPEYRLVASDIAFMRSNMQSFIDYRKKSF